MDQPISEAVIDCAWHAGQAILDVYHSKNWAVQQKADQSPLTAADLASHQLIEQQLRQLTPEVPVLSEESADIPWSTRQNWKRFWLVDPLDGTKEFLKRNDEFTVNIALIEQGVPVWGVVYAPALGQTWAGSEVSGSWQQDTTGPRRQIRARSPLPAEPLRVVASRSHRSAAVDALLAALPDYTVSSHGSSLKLCTVAAGEAHLYPRLGPTCGWDTAAAHAVCLGAGAEVIDPSGQPLRYQREEHVNPWFLVGQARVLAGLPPIPGA